MIIKPVNALYRSLFHISVNSIGVDRAKRDRESIEYSGKWYRRVSIRGQLEGKGGNRKERETTFLVQYACFSVCLLQTGTDLIQNLSNLTIARLGQFQ
jgi:hypothetical protein